MGQDHDDEEAHVVEEEAMEAEVVAAAVPLTVAVIASINTGCLADFASYFSSTLLSCDSESIDAEDWLTPEEELAQVD
jgi:hypothetical protein